MKPFSPLICSLGCALALASGTPAAGTPAAGTPGRPVLHEVVVLLRAQPLAYAEGPRAAARARIAAEQRRFVKALHDAVPASSVRWRYRLVANGLAVVVPGSAVPRLRSLPGVRDVVEGTTYSRASTAASVAAARAAARWTPGLASTGEGMKIGIIDDGVDIRHPFFAPGGYTMPPGFPKGQKAYTTAKVIVARAFPPPGAASRSAGLPFDRAGSSHGTHVAGIAAGNAETLATGGRRVSGVAPRAQIGNYKVLTVPTDAGVGLDGNAPEIAAAIEAAVADGMDVINLSIGEPEVEPTRDIVALALDAAAAMGVVPVVAAGNDFDEFGRGSLASPGTSASAITVAAATSGEGEPESALASFSSAGPTPISLRLKPDVSAPGVGVLSSVPGGWEATSGTSMASPHVAGAAALLLERHPGWTVAQVKAALVGSADPVRASSDTAAGALPTRVGGGMVDLPRADRPLLFATPASVSFGLVQPGFAGSVSVDLADAGSGAGSWAVTVDTRAAPAGASLAAPASVDVPGALVLTPVIPADAPDGDLTGWVTLTRDTDVRRIPFWLRVTRPLLASAPSTPLLRPGTYTGSTRGRQSLVSTYRYPDVPAGGGIATTLDGPEQVFRVTLRRPATNFGVVLMSRAAGASVQPRVVVAGDENRLTGYAALPLNINPYLAQFGSPVLAAGAIRPLRGAYDVVFDSPAGGEGTFTFRFWLDDVSPPRATVLATRVRRSRPLRVRVSDAGSGIDPATILATIGGTRRAARLRAGVISVSTIGLRRGRHLLRLQVSDYQESRNMENVPPILPNTRVVRTAFVVR